MICCKWNDVVPATNKQNSSFLYYKTHFFFYKSSLGKVFYCMWYYFCAGCSFVLYLTAKTTWLKSSIKCLSTDCVLWNTIAWIDIGQWQGEGVGPLGVREVGQ